MAEMMVLLQALLLVAGWLLFLRAQAELRAQAARQSLTGEMEELRRTIDALLQRLTREAESAEARVQAAIHALQQALNAAQSPQPPPETTTESPPVETPTPVVGYKIGENEPRAFGTVAVLAQQGLSIQEIAHQTGYAPGEVELILNLQRRHSEEE